MKPCGEPLEIFACLTELLIAIKDIIKCIGDLIERKVLDRDISLCNLILAQSDPRELTSHLQGYIIDFDYTIDLENITDDVAKGARTGTLPFMALEMLVDENSNKVPHAYYHDLESVFYALCWLCTSQEGPYNMERKRSDTFDFDKSEVAKWNGVGMENSTLDDIQRCKVATIHDDSDFIDHVLNQIVMYFEPIKSCIVALRDLMINEGLNTVDHYLVQEWKRRFQSLYDIIDSTLATLVEPPISPRRLLPKEEKCNESRFKDNARKIKTVRDVLEKKEATAIDKVIAIEEKKRQEKDKKDKKKQKVVDEANAALQDSKWTAREPGDGRQTMLTGTNDSSDIPEGEILGSGPHRLFEMGS